MRLLLALLLLSACAPTQPASTPPARPHALVLVSIDGFRHDYLERVDADIPTLRALAREGVRARRLTPVFPSNTFPNHYSLVTGLHPEAHGIVDNSMRDYAMPGPDGAPATFSLSNRDAIADGRWWGGEPVWATAERQGTRAATMFWPGSEAEIGGIRPSDWMPYDGDLAHAARVDTILAWLDRPDATRPRLMTLYFSSVDSQGHRHGPDAPEVARAIEDVDASLARLIGGLAERGLADAVDLVVVSDHGMAAVSRERVVVLDEAVDVDALDIDWGALTAIWPDEGTDVDALVAQLNALDHVQAFRKEDLPERLHYSDNARIAPVLLMADEGWTITNQDYLDRRADRPSGGSHGYDPLFESMGAFFAARGPSFRTQVEIDSLHAVDVYGILTRALGLTPAPNAGDPAAADRVLR
jgi:predicted AlkP superfamily pyrophosphatase or phosphodiesterase